MNARIPIDKLGLVCTIAAALCSPPALADDPTPPSPPPTEAKQMPSVVVTGSHIRRAELETAQPVLVLKAEDLQRSGLDNLGEVLQQLPQHASDLNSDWNNGGNGETRVDLRNLGSNRTLVLLNGRRFVNTLDGSVDVGSIPLAIVKRIEILTDGASAIYGSDAIAGVINIITRGDYDGSQFDVRYATSEHGDGQRRAADATWGRQGDRGGFSTSLSVADQQPIFAGDRAISAVPIYGLPANEVLPFGYGASKGGPNGRFGFGPYGNRLPDGSRGQLTWDPAQGAYRPFDNEIDGYNYAPQNYLRTPYRQLSSFTEARRDFGQSTTLRAILLLHHRDSEQQLAPKIISSNPVGLDEPIDIDAGNAFNAFGQPVTLFQFRPLLHPRRFDENVNTAYLSLSLEGLFTLNHRPFTWQIGWIAGRTEERDRITDGYDLNHIALGLGPSFADVAGTHCGTPSAPIAGCVPLDILHGQSGFTPAMYDYVTANAKARQTRSLSDFHLGIFGTAFELPAGPASIAAGLEFRSEHASVRLDPLLTNQAFDFGGSPYQPVSGRDRIDEAYVELNLPLLKDRPWAHTLELDLAARHSRYANFGSTTNPKAMLSWRPTPDWLLRASASTGFRAPSADELYSTTAVSPTDDSFLQYDPCVANFTGAVKQRCIAAGVPAGGIDPPIGPMVISGSNPRLQPELSRNRSLGVVWSPRTIPNLDVSLDWWKIELRDTIDSMGAQFLPGLCYEQAVASACQYLTRDPATGWLTVIDDRLHNNGRYSLSGYDLGIGYQRDTRIGRFRLRWDTTYQARYDVQIPKGAAIIPTVGLYDDRSDTGWRIRSLLSLDWQRGAFGAGLQLRYYSALHEDCFTPLLAGRADLCGSSLPDPNFDGDPHHVIGARTYTDLSLRWKPNPRSQLRIGVDNAFNVGPPVSYNAPNSYDPSYDIPGRFWYADFQYGF